MSDGINLPTMVRVLPDVWIQPAHVCSVALNNDKDTVLVGLTNGSVVAIPVHDGKIIYDDGAAVVSVINISIKRANGARG